MFPSAILCGIGTQVSFQAAGARQFEIARRQDRQRTVANARIEKMQSSKMNPMFSAVIQATEEWVINAMVAAKTFDADDWAVSAHSATNYNWFFGTMDN